MTLAHAKAALARPDDAYLAFADALVASAIVPDPWLHGEPRFREEPVLVREHDLARMHRAAEAIAMAYDEVARLAAEEPVLLDDFFVLTPCQKLMAQASSRLWHGVARADVFLTDDDCIQICELNSDTPTGEPEALVASALAARSAPEARDPNVFLDDAVVSMMLAMEAAVTDARAAVGIVYPTEMPEDLPLVRMLVRALEARGRRAVLGAPFNLTSAPDGTARIFDVPCSLVYRHYKTDWWSERLPVWTDEGPFADPLPLAGPLEVLLRAQILGRTAIVNPFGAVVTQNKRAMAFMWEHLDRFSEGSRRAIEAFVPETVRLDAVHPELLAAEREAWVLKSDYGCEGDEVILGADVTQALWEQCLATARPERWIAQRRFEPARDDAGVSVNHGIFVVGGVARGLYARVQTGATDAAAKSAPALVIP